MSQSILFIGGGNLDDSIRHPLEQRQFSVYQTDELERAADLLTSSRVDLVIVKLSETADGIGFIRRIRSLPALAGTRVMAVGEWGTGQPTSALSAGADTFEPAPIVPARLVDAIERILNKRAAVFAMNS